MLLGNVDISTDSEGQITDRIIDVLQMPAYIEPASQPLDRNIWC